MSFSQASFFSSIAGTIKHIAAWVTSPSGDITYINPEHKKLTAEKQTPENSLAIYCVHGTADRSGSFKTIAEHLAKDLPEEISSINLVSFDERGTGKGIEHYALQLLEKIKLNGHKNVVLYGHSRGGLIAAYLTEYLAKNAGINVQICVPICSPFNGSDLALPPLSWVSDSVKQMHKQSEFLKDLRDMMLTSNHQYDFISAEKDSIVDPKSCYLPEMCKEERDCTHIESKGNGHLSLQQDIDFIGPLLIASNKKAITQFRSVEMKAISAGSELKEDKEEDAVLVEKNSEDLHLTNVCYEIDLKIKEFEQAYRIQQAVNDVEILRELRAALIDKHTSKLAEEKSIGKFIEAFYREKKILVASTESIAKSALKYSAGFFSSKAACELFIEELVKTYQHIAFPEKIESHPLSIQCIN